MAEPDYVRVQYPEPHLERTRRLLSAHPEVRQLFGPVPFSAVLVTGLVAAQVALAVALRHQPWWAVLAVAYGVGAFLVHGLWVLIHECTHNLVLKSNRANILLAIVANLPVLFPSAVSFRKYHLLHHRFQGDPEYDADLPGPLEARLVGNAWWRKALWLLFFWVFQATRVTRLKKVQLVDRWFLLNVAVQVAFIAAVWVSFGGAALGYLFLSSIFAIGLHPLGARWIQEHYLTAGKDNQETFSYYGPLNAVAFNVGYHNEHHDLMRVPWTRLPRVRAIAPELYEPLASHRSWTYLLLRFLFDSRLGLRSRVVRDAAATAEMAEPAEERATAPLEKLAVG